VRRGIDITRGRQITPQVTDLLAAASCHHVVPPAVMSSVQPATSAAGVELAAGPGQAVNALLLADSDVRDAPPTAVAQLLPPRPSRGSPVDRLRGAADPISCTRRSWRPTLGRLGCPLPGGNAELLAVELVRHQSRPAA